MAARLEVSLGDIGSAWAAASSKKRSSGAFWEEEVVQLMMGRPLHHHLDVIRPSSNSSSSAPAPPFFHNAACSTTLDLLGSSSTSTSARLPPPPPPPPPPPQLPPFSSEDPQSSSSCCFDLDAHSPLPSGWEKCLDLQTGSIYYLNRSTGLSTSCDPRKATTSSLNWPTSPSSSSDLTYEGNVPMASSSKPITPFLEGPNHESTNLDLTLSLKPSSPCLRPNSLNHSLKHDIKSDFNHKLRSLISSQGPLNNQSFSSSMIPLPFNSTRTSFALPTCTSSTTSSTSPSSPSTLFFQELSVLKDMGSLGSSISSKESQSMSMDQSLNGISRQYISNNLSMNVREKPIISRETHNSTPTSKNFNVSANAKPIISDTPMNATSGPMITVGCANCLMFIMLPKSCSPKCPRCGASIDSDLPQPPSIKKPKLGFSFMN